MGRGGVEERSSWWELPRCPFLLVSLSLHPPRRSGPALFVYVAGLASERPGAGDFPRGAKELKGAVLLLLQGWYPWGNGSKGGKDVV